MDIALTVGMAKNDENNKISQTVKMYGKQLFSFIKGKVNSLEDAEDIIQDVWYQFSRLTNLNELENVSAWLYAVSRNKIIDQYRKKKTDKLEDYTFENSDGELLLKDVLLLDDSQDPERALFKELFWEKLMVSLEELPENQKQVFIWNEIEDKTLQEIATLTGENLKTIISRKGYAIKYLRKKLATLYQELN